MPHSEGPAIPEARREDARPSIRARRYRVRLPLELAGERCWSCDVSSTGVLFEKPGTARSYVPGDTLELVLLLPDPPYREPVRFHALGRVVRVETAGGVELVAVATSVLRFVAASSLVAS
jgi:hypothetical protein